MRLRFPAKQKLPKHFGRLKVKRLVLIFGGLLAVFIVLNLAVYIAFWHRTFPNTRVGNLAIGSTSYHALPQKVSSLPLLPARLSLQQHGQTTSLTPAELGIQTNQAAIVAASRSRAWLPLQNLFSRHDVPVTIVVNRPILTAKLTSLAQSDKRDPVNARIVMQNNQFSLATAAAGYQLNITAAAAVLIQAAEQRQSVIALPFTATQPAVTAASLTPTLRQLQSQQAVALKYTYNGKTTRPSAATIAGWYSLVNGAYVPGTTKIQAYITSIGTGDNIHVKNLSDAVTATRTALQKMTALNFALTAVPPGPCSSNTLSELMIVSISQRHLWACDTYNQVYDTPVVTGIEYLAADLTPTGTYHIYGKYTDTTLTGHDSTGSWSDYVNYWMPFLHNQYGSYGLHDATWRAPTDFGNIDPNSANASHGCVELPLAAAKWLYDWAHIGTTVTIQA